MFPSGNKAFYSYSGLIDAMNKYGQIAKTGSDTVRKQEAAAFLANVNHETVGLQYIDEVNTAVWGTYCSNPGNWQTVCPAGVTQYHGRGPMQLSWDFNYKAAGAAIGADLLHNPNLVGTDSSIAWQTGTWYWMTGTGAAGMTSHQAMTGGSGFGTTIRAINSIECGGAHPDQVASRVAAYQRFTAVLGVPAGDNLYC